MLKKIISLVILICICVALLKLGGYSWDSFKNQIHLRDPGTVLSPLFPNSGGSSGNSNGNSGGYTFDPNASLGGNSNSGGLSENSTYVPDLGDNSNSSEDDTNSIPTDSTTADSNSNTSDTSNESSETLISSESSEISEETTKNQSTAGKIFDFVIDGVKQTVTKDNIASFLQWLQQNFKDNSDVSYDSTDILEPDQSTQSNTLPSFDFSYGDTASLTSSITIIDKLPNYNDYDRTTFESPSKTYVLDGKKVNRNDYAWKTSPYFDEESFTYTCPYTGKVITDLDDKKEDKDFGNLDYDHIVPLKSAYLRGADKWTEEQRNAYAYDQFVGVDVLNSANRSKSDKGPAEWLPDVNKGSYCYSWLVICNKYNLSMTQEEINICNDEISKAIANGEAITFMGGHYDG